jgi:hypothetical protein
MIDRERQGHGQGSAVQGAPTDLAAPLSPLLLTASGAASVWEQWYEQASPAQRQQALRRAEEQGLLFSHHLPAPEGTPACSRRSLLTALLHGPAPELEPIRCAPVEVLDESLDACQRQAVARALASPDLSMILGYPGSGKSRVVAEVLRQAVRAGQRVLFLAPTQAAVDRVLERLGGDSGLGVLRCRGNNESLTTVPAALAVLTREHRLRTFAEQTLPAARRAVATAAAHLEARRRDESTWRQLTERIEQVEQARERLRAVDEQRTGLANLDAELEGTSDSPLRAAWEPLRVASEKEQGAIEARLTEVRAERERIVAEQKQRDAEQQELVPLAEAKQGHRWWTGAFWRATLQGSRLVRLEQLQAESHQAEERLNALQTSETELLAAKAENETRLAQQRRELVESERLRREADLAGRQQSLEGERDEAARAWRELLPRLSGETALPAEATGEATASARALWAERLERAELDLTLRQQWLEALEQAQPTLPAQLAASARIVASTLLALPADQDFGERGDPSLFDLLVIDEAQRLSDGELLTVSRRARRWLLVGDVAPEFPVPPPPRRHAPPRPRPVQARPAFQRLWNQLHSDPRRLPVRWRMVDGRLVAGLRPIAVEHEPWVQYEPVFDRPEIHVRIVAVPQQEPQVAEVVFPGTTAIGQAKEFIYSELQELAVQTGGPGLRWSEHDGQVTLELGGGSDSAGVQVHLEAGVRELVAPGQGAEGEVPWQTCGLAFDGAAGWDRTRAERWVAERLGLRDCGRTTVLGRCYRAREPLARFLADLVYPGLCAAPREWGAGLLFADLAAVELVPVPGPGRPEGRRGDHEPLWGGGGTATMTPRLRPVKGGAGLEIDLSDPRRAEMLPADLRSALPPRGVVNLAEARAIVSMLEAMAGDPAFRAALAEAQGKVAGPMVAVMSLFPTQIELLRLLIGRSAILSGSGSPLGIEVGSPGAFHQREALVGVVSLTRSHASRAVPFTDAPGGLLLALSRAISRLVLVGDPGTMVRRSQWHGGLDHLDEVAGPLEQTLISRLLEQLTEPDVPARLVRPRESSSV